MLTESSENALSCRTVPQRWTFKAVKTGLSVDRTKSLFL